MRATIRRNRLLIAFILSALFGVMSSSIYLAQFPHGQIIFPWEFPLVSILSVALSGFLLTLYVYSKPDALWPVLIGVNLFTVGIYVLRFPIYDEYLTACIMLGIVFAIMSKRINKRKHDKRNNVWLVIFMLLMIHLFIMSLFGYFAYDNVKALRFSIIYFETLIIVFIIARYDLPLPTLKSFVSLILHVALCYYLLTLLHGYLANLIRPQAHIMESIGFGGTAYQAVIGCVTVPVAIIAIKHRWLKLHKVAIITLLLGLIVAILADSRAGMLPYIVVALLLPFCMRTTRLIKMTVFSLFFVIVISWIATGHLHWINDMGGAMLGSIDISGGSKTFEYYGRTVTAAKGDTGRFLYVSAGLSALMNNPTYLLTGAGSYGFFPVAGPYYEMLAGNLGASTNVVNYGSSIGGVTEPPRPPALGASIIEAGLIGIMLMLSLIVVNVAYACLRIKKHFNITNISRDGILAGVPAILIIPWSYFGEIQDMILLYLIVAPYGITYVLSMRLRYIHEQNYDFCSHRNVALHSISQVNNKQIL